MKDVKGNIYDIDKSIVDILNMIETDSLSMEEVYDRLMSTHHKCVDLQGAE